MTTVVRFSGEFVKSVTAAKRQERLIDLQGPIVVKSTSGIIESGLMIDAIDRYEDRWEFRGWVIGSATFEIFCDQGPVEYFIRHHSRNDVAKDLKVDEPSTGFGFLLSVPTAVESLEFVWVASGIEQNRYRMALKRDISAQNAEVVSDTHGTGVSAYLEVVGVVHSVNLLVIAGWVLGDRPENLLLQCGDDFPVRFESVFCTPRPDVLDAFGKDALGRGTVPGFLGYAKFAKLPTKLRLLQYVGRAVDRMPILAEKDVRPQTGDPVKIFKWLSGINSQSSTLPARFAVIDVPVLEEVNKRDRAAWPSLPVQRQIFGAPPKKPTVSIIIPLYKRIDFVEHQLMLFSRDQWIRKNVEIIYVLDDPTLLDAFITQTRQWYRLFDLPFKWVFGTVNRGFSGANNLGAAEANGPLLLFMNSDVFPIKEGWLKSLVETLEKTKDAGVVAPKLLHLDGSIQHAGMEFQYRSDLGFCINHHPNMGLSSELDSGGKTPVAVPAVTGACMLIRRAHFYAIGQWDTGYLIGDFEDSDLCHKIAELGFKAIYEPRVSLTHLERQSFVSTGSDDFRYRVVVFNAVRHQKKWLSRLQPVIDAAN